MPHERECVDTFHQEHRAARAMLQSLAAFEALFKLPNGRKLLSELELDTRLRIVRLYLDYFKAPFFTENVIWTCMRQVDLAASRIFPPPIVHGCDLDEVVSPDLQIRNGATPQLIIAVLRDSILKSNVDNSLDFCNRVVCAFKIAAKQDMNAAFKWDYRRYLERWSREAAELLEAGAMSSKRWRWPFKAKFHS
jgi:hypothetical protein